jgi:tRNA(adenine34) deaminase
MPLGHEHFMRLAIEEAARGGAEGNMAVGSLVVQGDRVVAYGRNREAADGDPTAHAEMVAVREAVSVLGSPSLAGLTLYTTWEPCPMCAGAIMASGIARLVLGARFQPTVSRWRGYAIERLIELAEWGDRLTVVTGVVPDECLKVRRDWEARNTGR